MAVLVLLALEPKSMGFRSALTSSLRQVRFAHFELRVVRGAGWCGREGNVFTSHLTVCFDVRFRYKHCLRVQGTVHSRTLSVSHEAKGPYVHGF